MRCRGGEVIYVYVSGRTFSPLSLPPDQMQNAIMAPPECTNATFMMDECGI